MTHPKKKNLLEAFRSASAASEAQAPAPRVEPRSSVAPSPSGGLHAADRPEHTAERRGHTAERRGLPEPPRWLFPGVGLVLAFAFGFLTGRLGRDEVTRAGSESGPEATSVDPGASYSGAAYAGAGEEARVPRGSERAPAERPIVSPPGDGAPGATQKRIEESSLFDSRNTHTVVVATYDRQAEDLALATYKHLVDARLPAFPPVVSGKYLVVLVGAADSSTALEADEQAVRALVRDGERPYSTAYRARIDSILTRK